VGGDRAAVLARELDVKLRGVAVAIGYVVIAVALTWPLARLLPIAVTHPGDPLITSWILSWNVHALSTAPLEVYDANIFYPARQTLALSENLFGLTPIAALLSLVASPLTVHNVLLILGFAFSALGMYVLGRTLGADVFAAFAAGAVYGFVPWRFVHLSHLQHAWGGWLPLMLAAIVSYRSRRSPRAMVFFALAALMNGLTNLHYLVFGLAAALLAIVVLRAWRLLAVLLAVALILAAILAPYRNVQRGNMYEAHLYSASLSDWARDANEQPERRVFPGWIAIAVTAVALIRRRWERWQIVAVLLIAAGVFCSLGIRNPLYWLLYEHLPGLSGIRAPARWAVLAYLGMAMLIILPLRRWWLSAIVAILALAQVFAAPLRWYLLPREPSPVYKWMKTQQPRGGTLELPIGVNERDFYYLHGAAIHHQRIFNGASGALPPIYRELVSTFSAPEISDTAIPRLRELGASFLIVHADALGDQRLTIRRWLKRALERGELAYLGRFESMMSGDYVFAFDRPGKPIDDALTAFIDNRGVAFNEQPFGMLQTVTPDMNVRGALNVSGWALSSRGVKRVRVWIANKACYADAQLSNDAELQRIFPKYSAATARFTAAFEKRPCGKSDSDVLVEITDHGGATATLPHVWFRWE
jgi:hypothetical protein